MTRIARYGRNGSLVASLARLSVFVVLGSGASHLFAAQTDEEPDVLRVGAQLVQVNVVVTGDDGPVHGLTVDDFTVLDDGVERRIEVFEVIRSATVDSDPGAMLPDNVVSNRLDRRGRRPESATALLIDRLNTLGRDQAFMDQQAREFLAEASAAGEHVVVLELGDEGLTVLADFTAPPEAIRDALEVRRPSHSLTMGSSLEFFTGGLDPILENLRDRLEEEQGTGESEGSSTILEVDPDELPDTVEFEVQLQRYFMNRRLLMTAAALEASARHLARLPGRKNLVWMAAQFPFPYEAWQDTRFTSSTNFMPPSTLNRIDAVFREIVDSDVAVYPIDVMGIRNPDSTEDMDFTLDLPMKIAEVTGGRASFNTNGLATRIREAVRDMHSNYSLGFYVPEVESDAEFHELEVRVDRDDVEVLHRDGYFGFGADATGAGDLDRTLEDPFNATGIGLLATAEPVPDATGRYTVTLAVDVNDIELNRAGDHWAGSLAVAASFYIDALDRYSNLPPVMHAIRLTDAQFETARRLTGLIIQHVVETDGYAGQLRLAVQDPATGATGSLWLSLGGE